MVALLDVNLLVALAWPNHIYHAAVLNWFLKTRSRGWATCPLTESGFVRVSSNSRAIPDAVTPQEAILLLQRMVAFPDHVFWGDEVSFADSELIARDRLYGYRQVSDAHLLAVALQHGGRVATLDSSMKQLVLPPFSPEEVVCLLPG